MWFVIGKPPNDYQYSVLNSFMGFGFTIGEGKNEAEAFAAQFLERNPDWTLWVLQAWNEYKGG